MAPFVGDGSTRLEPSRRKARPALNARRVLEFDIRMCLSEARIRAVTRQWEPARNLIGSSFPRINISRMSSQSFSPSLFLCPIYFSLSTSPYTTDPISAVTIPS